ncbi:UNVERIFIED_CONTAM: glycerol-3-phosphate dehydrogenase, partial [Siphonaria sp. JEL0065]
MFRKTITPRLLALASAGSAVVVASTLNHRSPLQAESLSISDKHHHPSQLWIPPTRDAMLKSLNSETEFDLLICGGGATGVGCALDAATRGLKVALVERDDFSS